MSGAPRADGGATRLALAAACLGLVLGALALAYWTATRNFALADFARTPKAQELLAPIEGDEARLMAARWFASESNRALFSFLGPLLVAGVGAALLLAHDPLVARRLRLARGLLAVALADALVLAALVPLMVTRGRAIDFISRAHGTPPEVASFLAVHGIFMAGTALLLILAVLLVALLARAAARAPESAPPAG